MEPQEQGKPEVPEVSREDWLYLARAILTVTPAVYFAIRIYLRTHNLSLALGAGIVCPFVVYYLLRPWLENGSWLMRSSFAGWSAHPSEKRRLLAALAGALICIAAVTVTWFAISLVTDY